VEQTNLIIVAALARPFGILDFVEVVLVELSYKRGKIGMFEMPRQQGLCELVDVLRKSLYQTVLVRGGCTIKEADLDDEAVAVVAPRDYMLKCDVLEHADGISV
jgi:hypothetical protein